MSKRRRDERAAHRAQLNKRRRLIGVALALLVGIGLMISVDRMVGVAAGMLISLAAVYFTRE